METLFERLMHGERKTIEFKEKLTKSMYKTVSAFSNYHDGKIIIGVNDSGTIIGVENAIQMRLSIENAINDGIKPRPYFEIDTLQIENRTVIVLSIFKGEHTPYTFEKKAYRRSDTSTVEIEKLEYDELVLLGRHLTFEELPCEVNELKFNKLETKLYEMLEIPHLTEDVLKSLELIKNGWYNRAAELLADSNRINGIGFDYVCYSDSRLLQIKDRIQMTGVSLLDHYEKSISFFEKHMNYSETIRGMYRETNVEVPLVAYREAIANAIVHRDYSRTGNNRVEFFSDRIEIVSIGGLPVGLTEAEFLRGSFSNLRNRIIADLFYRLKMIEKLGTGIRRIKEAYAPYAVKPTFEVMQNSIIIVLPKIPQMIAADSGVPYGYINGQGVEQRLDYASEKAIHAIRASSGLTRMEIETLLGVKRTKATQVLNSLLDLKLIIAVGNGRNTRYKAK